VVLQRRADRGEPPHRSDRPRALRGTSRHRRLIDHPWPTPDDPYTLRNGHWLFLDDFVIIGDRAGRLWHSGECRQWYVGKDSWERPYWH
jgi:hypothetical protein